MSTGLHGKDWQKMGGSVKHVVIGLVVVGVCAGGATAGTRFTEVSDIVETPVGGRSAAFGDVDNDGWPELFLAGTGVSAEGNTILHHNAAGAAFTAGGDPPPLGVSAYGGGSVFGDYDNDGDLDLFVPRGLWEPPLRNLLLRNDEGVFHEVGIEAGLLDVEPTDNAIWLDYDRDGRLDLYTGNLSCGEGADPSVRNRLYRNTGDGRFADVTVDVGLGFPLIPEPTPPDECVGGSNGGMSGADLNDDGWPDLYVGVFGAANRLFLNEEGRFVEASGGDIAHQGEAFGAAVGDIDGDGDLDIYQAVGGGPIGLFIGDRSRLYLNLGGGIFTDVTGAAGLEGENSSNLTASFADFDNDGDLDLLNNATTGNAPTGAGSLHLVENDGSGFYTETTEASGLAGINDWVGSVGDYDLDGFLDMASGSTWLHNEGNGNHWLVVLPVGTRSNRSAVGARVVARDGTRRQVRQILGGRGYHQDEMIAHFGLGGSTRVDELVVQWPSGQVDTLRDIDADQRIRVIEGQGTYHPATPMHLDVPEAVVVESRATVSVRLRGGLFERDARVTRARVDLSPLGGPADLELGAGPDGSEATIVLDIDGPNRVVEIEAFVEQETSVGRVWSRPVSAMVVAPATTVQVSGDVTETGWELTAARNVDSLARVSKGDGIEGEALRTEAGASFAGWWLKWTPATPVPRAGYRLVFAVRPQLDPAPALPRFTVAAVSGKPEDLLAGGVVDPALDAWQVVDLPLSDLDGSGDIEAIQLSTSYSGVLWIDDMRLVPITEGLPPTAVVERREATTPRAFALEPAYPNPFNASTTIGYALAAAGDVEVSVYDLVGQRVAVLAAGAREAGSYRLRWDGRDDGGRALASGIYVVRLVAGGEAASRKVLLLR